MARQGGRSCLTLAREVTYNPTFRVLQFSPVAEIAALRGTELVNAGAPAAADRTFYGGDGAWPHSGRMIEVIATFAKTDEPVSASSATGGGGDSFGVCLGVPSGDNSSCPVRIEMREQAASELSSASLASSSSSSSVSMIVVNGSGMPMRESALANMGVRTGEMVAVRAFVDQNFAEVYVNQGRVTMTGWSLPSGDLGFATFSGGGYKQKSVVAHAMNQAWLPP
jgi:sucrose-6-phosphate hydrolase SacC (GH32 family)